MGEIASLVANLLHSTLVRIPLTRVDVDTSEYEIILSDITVLGGGFAPDIIRVSSNAETNIDFGNQGNATRSSFSIAFHCSNITPVFENCEYSFKRKTSPTYSDHGRCTVACLGHGLRFTAVMGIKRSKTDQRAQAYVRSFDVELGPLSIKTSQEKHSTLTPLMTSLFKERVRLQLERTIQQNLRVPFENAVEQINKFYNGPVQKVASKAGSAVGTAVQKGVETAQEKVDDKRKSRRKSTSKDTKSDEKKEHKSGEKKEHGHGKSGDNAKHGDAKKQDAKTKEDVKYDAKPAPNLTKPTDVQQPKGKHEGAKGSDGKAKKYANADSPIPKRTKEPSTVKEI